MISLATVIAALAIFGAGHLVLGVLRLGETADQEGERPSLERQSLAVLLGLALWAFGLMALGLAMPIAALGSGLGTGLAVTCALAGLAVAWRTRAARTVGLAAGQEPWTLLERVAAAIALFFAAFSVFYASTMPVHIFDPVFHFAYKGKLLYHEGLMQAGWTDVEDAVGRVITHPDYPPGVGALEALVSVVKGSFSSDEARPLFALFVLATGGLLFARLAHLGRRAALTGALLWLASPFLYYSRPPHKSWLKGAYGLFVGPDAAKERFGITLGPKGPLPGEWTMPDGWTLDGAGDLPLAALFSAGALLLFGAITGRGRRGDAGLAGILIGGGALMKNEGLALVPVVLIAAVLAWLWTEKRPPLAATARKLAAALGLALVVASPWLSVRGSVPTIGEDYPSRLTPSGLIEAATSTQPIRVSMTTGAVEEQLVPRIVAGGFLDAFTHIPRFGILWLAFFFALGYALLHPRRRLTGATTGAALCVLGASALYALVLTVTPWNLDALFKTAIPDRLVFHVAPLAIFALVSILGTPSAGEPDLPA